MSGDNSKPCLTDEEISRICGEKDPATDVSRIFQNSVLKQRKLF